MACVTLHRTDLCVPYCGHLLSISRDPLLSSHSWDSAVLAICQSNSHLYLYKCHFLYLELFPHISAWLTTLYTSVFHKNILFLKISFLTNLSETEPLVPPWSLSCYLTLWFIIWLITYWHPSMCACLLFVFTDRRQLQWQKRHSPSIQHVLHP